MESGVFESEGDDCSNDDFCFFSSAKVGEWEAHLESMLTPGEESCCVTRETSPKTAHNPHNPHTHTLHTLPTTRRKLAGERSSPRARLTSHFDITSHPSPVGHPSLVSRSSPSVTHHHTLCAPCCARAVDEPKLFLRERAMLHKLLPACRSSPSTCIATPPTRCCLCCHTLGRSIRPRSSPQQSISPCALHSSPLPLSQHFPSKHER
jgi:hypothetical protein